MLDIREMDLPELLDVSLDVDGVSAEERFQVRKYIAYILPHLDLHNYKDLTWEQQLCLKLIANPPVRTGKPLRTRRSTYGRN